MSITSFSSKSSSSTSSFTSSSSTAFKNLALYRGVPAQFAPQSAAMTGGVIGGLAGTGIDNYASILSRANAIAAGKPTFKEIKEYYEDPNRKLKTYFIPGYSSYHATRNAMASDIL